MKGAKRIGEEMRIIRNCMSKAQKRFKSDEARSLALISKTIILNIMMIDVVTGCLFAQS